VVSRDRSGKEHVNVTLPSGTGNSHTLAPPELKLMQLATVVAAAESYFGMVSA